ncbi:phosphate acyltransferase PlsX [candidate division KSB1 bacterium]
MSNEKFTIAVDAMGGDFAPSSIVEGAMLAVSENPGRMNIVLVGDEQSIRGCSPGINGYADAVTIQHASQIIGMNESPVDSLKQKPKSSISVTSNLLKEKKVDAIFSAGNTGAHMAASLFSAGRTKGVSRPTIGTFYPRINGPGFLLDIGANTDCKPHHLFQFGIMGSILAKYILEIDSPRVGLLNIGEEPLKGNAATIEAHKLFTRSSLNFIGNVEGGDIFTDAADVIVCDGFVGNILLKLFETYGLTVEQGFRKNLRKSITERLGHTLLQSAMKRFKEFFNYENHGGVPLLGVNGVSIIGHGSSSPAAVKSAIHTAKAVFENKIPEQIHSVLKDYKEKH